MASSSQYHIFSLPPELLANLTPRNLVGALQPLDTPPDAPVPLASTGVRTCNVCLGVAFADVIDQRSHFRSDWHRYNVKSRLANGKTVTEAQFANLVDSLEDSLSGSASSSDDDDSEADTVHNLLSKTRIRSRSHSPTDAPSAPQTALTWFHSPPVTQLGLYKAIFPMNTPPTSHLEELKAMQQGGGAEGRKWALFMVAGGHFAGVVVRVSRPDDDLAENDVPRKGKQKKQKPEMEILRHKTFHRYTTRRKQGGSQSVNDNAKGNAKSAGAQLRRYGEQALREDIRGLLEEWAEDIASSERIWLRASVPNRKIFLDYEGAVISKGDKRLRTFPFPTRRPTQSELSRCLMELTKIKITHFTEDQLREQDEAYLASLPKPKVQISHPPPEPVVPEKKTPKLSKEEEAFRDKWLRLIDMVKKGRLDAAKSFWEREGTLLGGVDAQIPEWAGERGGTLLQVAAHAGQEDFTEWLLDELHADPTISTPAVESKFEDGILEDSPADGITSPKTHRTAYDIASTRETRDVFRRSAAAHPDWWDWLGAGRVPSLLSKEMEEERDAKKKVKRKGLKDKIKEREAREQQKEPVFVEDIKPPVKDAKETNSATGPRKLGGASGNPEAVAGLTPEMRARIERERRARAAEARLKTLGH
ncbi:hypothetical protein BD410DRAFT_768276 [Rickenella mellea]|uniref:VLRF1 domain-containing protein n=1 Tax=Rickenella mellea TaxID=50990 RepID=A0A4Y7Q9A0_9AGAM|nr:hypothetical protein BD410DRAFT_768276 [Rickenella mellea]